MKLKLWRLANGENQSSKQIRQKNLRSPRQASKADSIQFYKRAHTKNTAQEQEEEIKTQQWPD
jgi:hypothetical protein